MKRHPRWSPTSPGDFKHTDFCSKAGAEELARRIKAAWFAAGYDIEARAVSTGRDIGEHTVWTVRMPDLIGGLAPPWREIKQ